MSIEVIALILPWVLIGVCCWLLYMLTHQYGRLVLRLEAIEKRLGKRSVPSHPVGLPVGSSAPDFALPDLAGEKHTLDEFRGRPVLLIFFNPECGFCARMTPAMAALESEGDDMCPVPLIVTRGDAEMNRRLIHGKGVRCRVLLQQNNEVAAQYKSSGTPSGYLIDDKGAIASEMLVGAPALLAVAQPHSAAVETDEVGGNKHVKGKVNKGLAASNLNRNGLKAGTRAPDLQLPRLDGGLWSLADVRGRRLLLVFSDPECGPCQRLAPYLEQLHRQRTDLQVVLLSRGDIEVNRRKVEQLGLTLPVVLQKHWEVSRLYAMFAAPIAYLIDEHGVISADVVKGVEPILALAAGVSPSNGQGVRQSREKDLSAMQV